MTAKLPTKPVGEKPEPPPPPPPIRGITMTEEQKRAKLIELIKRLILINGDMSRLLLNMADIIGDGVVVELVNGVVNINGSLVAETGTVIINMETTNDNAPA